MLMYRKATLWMVTLLFLSFLPGVARGTESLTRTRDFRMKRDVTSLKEMRSQYVTLQEYDYSCGAAVISTLLTYYFGEPASEKDVIAGLFVKADLKKVVERHAFSLLDMKRFAEAKGYKALGYKMDFDFLAEVGKPIIVPVTIRSYKHFVIVKGIVDDRVVVADPAYGNYTVRLARFLPVWGPRIGFVLEAENPRGPLTDEDLTRQAKFMSYGNLKLVVRPRARAFTPLPGRVQSITGPRPTGRGSSGAFSIRVTPPAGSR
jgi:predicted double-glycine peptidase